MSTFLYYDQECGNLSKAAFCLKLGAERIVSQAPTVHVVSLPPTPAVFQVSEKLLCQSFKLKYRIRMQC